MKKILLYCGVLLSFYLDAQTTLSQSFNEPKPGDMESGYDLDTSAFSSGMPLNVTGNNAVWNFTNLKADQPPLDSYYLSAASETSSANYPGCTMVEESGGIYSYYKSTTTPTTQTEVLGIKTSTVSITFTNSGIIAKYPISYGYSLTDNISGTFSFSVSGTCSGSITTTADGQGTLNLPEGLVLTNVLRVKSVQTLTLTAFVPVATMKQTIYNYYVSSQKFPVLSVNYSKLTSSFSSTPTITGFATGSTNYFVTGLEETVLKETDVKLFPNPVHSVLNITLHGSVNQAEIGIYNQLGQLVLKTSKREGIDISDLNNGIYIVEIRTDKGLARKKMIKDH